MNFFFFLDMNNVVIVSGKVSSSCTFVLIGASFHIYIYIYIYIHTHTQMCACVCELGANTTLIEPRSSIILL